MLYTGAMSRNKKNARSTNNGPGRKIHFEEGRGAEHINAPGKDTYAYGNGTVINLTPDDKKRMATKNDSYQWHSADPKAGTKAHHTYIDYVDGCKQCEDLEEKRMHPNGTKPGYDDGR